MSTTGAGSMRDWVETAERIRATRRTSEKVAIVAGYLRTLDDPDLSTAAVFLSGRPFPERDDRRVGLGWAAISTLVEQVAGSEAGALRRAYDRSSDLGTAVGEVLGEVGHAPARGLPELTLTEVAAAYEAVAEARGRAAKGAAFADLLARAEPLTARYVTAILSGELRIGLREGHLEAGIAAAFGRDVGAVQWAGMLSGDIGQTARLSRADALDTVRLSLFHPLKSMLASAVADEEEVFRRLSPPVWVEDKYDGIRAQLHKLGREVRLFSRDLNDVTRQFPEIGRAASVLPWDGILDGEILAWKDGLALPFLRLQSRLGRKAPSEAVMAAVPVIFVAFDVLALGGWLGGLTGDDAAGAQGGVRHDEAGPIPVEPFVRLPLRERRRRLEALGLERTPGFGLAALVDASGAPELARIFVAARERGNEGLMLKDPDSIYAPGRRGYAWLKLKKALTTLECIVVGVEVGHGRRHGVLSDYTFAVIDDRVDAPAGRLVTVGKAYSGLSDAEIAQMTPWFEEHTITRHGRYRVVEPSVVVEIAFDVVHASDRHASGYALRFPRIVRIRHDKRPHEVDRLSSVAALYARQAEPSRHSVLTGARPELAP